jgi:hypothetical protein
VCFWEAPLFQSFNVEIFTKVRTKVEIHLGISGERVEIDPCQQASTARFWQKQKAVSYDLDRVVSCEVVERVGCLQNFREQICILQNCRGFLANFLPFSREGLTGIRTNFATSSPLKKFSLFSCVPVFHKLKISQNGKLVIF